ncbi:hypothetical protein POJ06DRAFT_209326 [Lipomyces tetrasporus]|uniref:Endosomal peripheral membrane protein n=1 Tax=Lipomyces tetrasporus TaxID=54092 RepID=A0AAD7QU71_9ASCO|nr:uncharacterized protein POJ06DRAFT_209326 [Lipomyces tetrasporus]KAJ8101555.1 hypothetical protein POJ06DRAFT_209326 [Lipomyces tetrasporus]
MGSIALLTADLTNLLSETKRRYADLRQACEKSISEIKSLSSSSKQEQEILRELSSSPTFASPFLIACSTRNVKYCAIAVQSLQRLITTQSLNKAILPQMLDAFQEGTQLGVEIQLKILQSLPPLIEKYGSSLGGDLLAKTIQICSTLQGSKIAVVVNTASATLQQLSVAVFDEIITEDLKTDIDTVAEVPVEDGKSHVNVRPAAYDAFRVFQDICFLTEGNKPKFLKVNQVSETFGLELIESIISNHSNIFNSHPEQTYILRTYVFPYILRSLSERREFSIIVRVIRILYLILRRHLAILPVECEVALTLLTHTLDADVAPYWKRVLAMEVFQGVFAEYALVRKFYSEYDSLEGRQNVLRSLVTAVNKLSAEKPAIIGLRRSSTSLFTSKDGTMEQLPPDASTIVSGLLSGAVAMSSENAGLSVQTSSVRVLCIDQLDKNEPPALPESYLYYLALNCINSLADGMTRFLLPLSLSETNSTLKKKASRLGVADDGKDNIANNTDFKSTNDVPAQVKAPYKRRAIRYRGAPINPLTLESHPLLPEVRVTADIVRDCWPPLLAAFSTFLYSNLDSDLYHNLVRSFQKFTQSAGLLQLVTPRDAFLTTLAKVAVPSQIFTGSQSGVTSPNAERQGGLFNSSIGILGETLVTSRDSAGSGEGPFGMLHVRNLLCLRALLNLAIALGPTLKESWTIIIETLQQADFVLHSNGRRPSYNRAIVVSASTKSDGGSAGSAPASNGNGDSVGGSLAGETNAVDNAVKKLLECTKDFPDDSFLDLINAFCKISSSTINLRKLETGPSFNGPPSPLSSRSQEASESDLRPTPTRQSSFNVPKLTYGDPLFALIKLGEIAEVNINRLVFSSPDVSGWDAFVKYFIQVLAGRNLDPSIRMRAAEVLNSSIYSAVVEASNELTPEGLDMIQTRCLIALEDGMYSIIRQGVPVSELELSTKSAEAEIHCTTLNTLNDILDRTGSSLTNGWETVFSIITSFFVMHHYGSLLPTTRIPEDVQIPAAISNSKPGHGTKAEGEKITKLVKAAFGSLQLICNDFLTSMPQNCFIDLIDLLYYFCHQQDDLNISFTTITFFWTVSDYLRSKLTDSNLSSDLSESLRSRDDLITMAKSGNLQDSTSSVWLILLFRLTVICADPRPEVRNGAIQILFRIFDSYGHLLGVNSWSACLWIVIYAVMEVRPPPEIPIEYVDKRFMQAREAEQKQWSETMALILSGLSRLYSTFFYAFLKQPDFTLLWSTLLRYFQSLISIRRSEIIVSVFKAVTDILQGINESKSDLPSESIEETWKLWSSQERIIIESEKNTTGVMTQDSLTAYVSSFKSLYLLMEGDITVDKIEKMLSIMRSCLLFPELPPYFSDMDYHTPLQSAIMEVVMGISTKAPGSASLILRTYGEFSSFAYREDILGNMPVRTTGKAKKPTYISISVQCFDLVLEVFKENLSDRTLFADGSLAFVLEMLAIPIQAKYNCPAYASSEDGLTLWMLASNVFIQIAERTIPGLEGSIKVDVDQKIAIWTQITVGTAAIVKSNSTSVGSSTSEDEQFDIVAFQKLEKLIVPYLGDKDLPDNLIEHYISTLFYCSFLYVIIGLTEDKHKDINKRLGAIFNEPLLGSTEALNVLPRQNMSYVCFGSLFSLSTVEDRDSPERRRLAEAALPYLLLRCALILHRFAADQPLRGNVPAPKLQRKELIYILSRLLALTNHRESSNSSAEELQNDLSTSYRPLLRLFPLLSKGILVSKGDYDVLHLLQAVFEKIGNGIDTC